MGAEPGTALSILVLKYSYFEVSSYEMSFPEFPSETRVLIIHSLKYEGNIYYYNIN